MKPLDFKPTVEWNKPIWYLAVLLAALSMLGPFAVDTYLPAFEGIAADIGASPVGMQQTLSAYLLAYSVMTLLHGALSDSFGRRPVILIGVAVFGLSSVVCAMAQSIGMLVLGRIAQGMSCGAGIVVGRAIVRDLFTAHNAQRLMSQITLFFGIAPALAPIIGGWLFALIGWRAIFVFLVIVSAALWLFIWLELPETLPCERRQSFDFGPLMRGYWGVLSDRYFLLLTFASGVPFNAIFIFILAAPTLLGHHLGLPPTRFFWLFLGTIAGIMGGAWTSGRLAGRITRERQIRIGFTLMLAAAVVNLVLHLFVPMRLFTIVPLILLIAYGWSLLTPCVTLLVLDRFPGRLGMASSLQAFFSSLSNAIVAGILVPLVMDRVSGLTIGSVLLGLSGLVSWKMYRSLMRREAGR
ncbi:MAG: multidrug effflux MFS transporter [Betaproteobacteria bacterium]|nr:multidrug effflux MFS transporter [Betaproteobacteria bacterium]